MKRKLIPVGLFILAGCLLTSSTLQAQGFDQFGSSRDQASQAQKPARKGIFDFSRSEKPANPFSGMFGNASSNQLQSSQGMQMPKWQLPKLKMPEIKWPKFEAPSFDGNGGGMFARPSWLPVRDPSQPNIFQRMNTKGKELVDRATGWAKGKSQDLSNSVSPRAKSSDSSWDSVRKEMERIKAQQAADSASQTANGGLAPKIRY